MRLGNQRGCLRCFLGQGDSATWTQKLLQSISMLLHAAAHTIFAPVAPRLLGGHELIGATVLGTNRPGV
ncbi:hypothetical protein HYQ46_003235 [Verticillium longisporum]|nr:hypothetical protein HYQ46_003235 [Verticillium longisporum]